MIELLYLKQKYDERQERIEKFSQIKGGTDYSGISLFVIVIIAICIFSFYIWVYSVAWSCFAKKKIPILPRIILCFVIMPVWLIFLIFYYTDILGCRK